MRKVFVLFLLSAFSLLAIAQKEVTKLELSGFIVTIENAETFSYEYDKTQDVEEKLSGDKLYLKVKPTKIGGFFGFFATERQERIPLKIKTNNIQALDLSNCKLVYDGKAFQNELKLNISAASNVELDKIILTNDFKGSFSSASDTKINELKAKNVKIGASSAANIKVYKAEVDELVKLELSSAANLQLTAKANELKATGSSAADGKLNINAKSVSLSASSAASFKVDIEAVNVNATASSGASIKLTGTVDEANASASSGGNVNGKNLKVKNKANSNSSSGGSVSVKSSGK